MMLTFGVSRLIGGSTRRQVVVWLSGNINQVNRRRDRLVLRWITVRRYTVLVCNQPGQLSLASLRG